ncbi:cell division protein FtsA [Sphingobacteriales bacterium UPWRP_1]|nr:cell division protein FtsA [Sphingobacteriales bacterium TSM_CSS]PSJ73149.1 cell division protein FtsA [Sphingobacteriales bacterium UPWRP_1]
MRKETLPIVAALDIGTTKICAIVARKNQLGKLEILGMGQADSQGVMRGVISNIDKTVEAIKLAVAEASKKSGIKIHHVYVGVAGQHVKYLRHRGYLMRDHVHDEITQADVDKLVSDMHRLALPPGERIIHVLPQEFIIDDEQGIKEPIGMSGVRLEADFHIITGQIAAMQNIHRCVEKAGLKAVELMLEPIASAAAVLNDEEKEAGVALVDIGGGTTDIVIFQEGIIRHTAVIPLGGNIITEDIKEGCMVMREQAEKLKVKFGKALAIEAQENAIVSIPGLRGRAPKEISVKNLAHIIQARMEEILEHVYFQIRLSGYENKLIGGIVVTGGGARLQDLQYLAEYLTGLDARIGLPAEQLSVNSQRSEFNDPMYATAIGLLVKATERNPVPTEEPEPEPAALPAEPAFEATPVVVAQEETEETQPAESAGQNGSWLENFLRRSREWLEGDIKDFQ